jgi:hypothetical protein
MRGKMRLFGVEVLGWGVIFRGALILIEVLTEGCKRL